MGVRVGVAVVGVKVGVGGGCVGSVHLIGSGDGVGGMVGAAHRDDVDVDADLTHLIGSGDGVGGMAGAAHRDDVDVDADLTHLIDVGVWVGIGDVWGYERKKVLFVVVVGVDQGGVRRCG